MLNVENFNFAMHGIKSAIDTVNQLSNLRDNLLTVQAELADATEKAYTGRLRLECASDDAQAVFENLIATITRVIEDNRRTADDYNAYLSRAIFTGKAGVGNEN